MIPGFTAETSVYQSRRYYRSRAQRTDDVNAEGASALGCVFASARSCQPCEPDESSPTGCSKTCNLPNGEDTTIPCKPCPGGCVGCHANQACCNGVCTNVLSDPSNCGICHQSCGVGQACCNATCVDMASVLGQLCTGCTEVGCPTALVTDDQLKDGDV